MNELIKWNIYEISAQQSSLNGVMLRGRIRKFGLERAMNVLAENAEDLENGVRFATTSPEDAQQVSEYVLSIIGDANVQLVSEQVVNPVLSKLKVNLADRYTL